MRYSISCCLVAAILVAVSLPTLSKASPFDLSNFLNLEEPCVLQGGLCIPREDCPEGQLVGVLTALCPRQSHLGVDCCYLKA